MKFLLLVSSVIFLSCHSFANTNVRDFVDRKLGCYLLKNQPDGLHFEISTWNDPIANTYSYSFQICRNNSCSGGASIPVDYQSVFRSDITGVLSYETYEGSSYRYFSFSNLQSEEFTVKTLTFLNGSSSDPENDPYVKVYHVGKKLNDGFCR